MPVDYSFDTQIKAGDPNIKTLAGVDEVGRGPWAGPVTACAVIFHTTPPEGLRDSKKLSAKRREALFEAIQATAHIGLGEATVAEIDQLNILQASFLAMRRALASLPTQPDFALIDGSKLPPDLPCPAKAIVKGDDLSPSISAAAIIAKVTRDRIMESLAQHYPGYGWETNAGYGTKMHQEGLQNLGVTPEHRRSFKPIHNILYG